MKLSKYLVGAPVPSDATPSHWLVYHTVRGTVALLDDRTWRIFLDGNATSLLAPEVILQATNAGYLVNDESDELAELLNENRHATANLSSWYQVIMPTAACQLACNEGACGAYCGQSHSNHILTEQHQDAIVERVRSQLATGRYKDLEIGWFGGEPLLGLTAIERLSPELRKVANHNSCTYRARMVTNGLKLSRAIARRLILECGIRSIEVTLDGDARHHDQRRCTKGKHKPTFEAILANIVAVSTDSELNECAIKLRCNVDRRNIAGVEPLLHRLVALNLQKRVQFYMAPVHHWGNDVGSISILPAEFASFEIQVMRWMQALGFDVQLLPKRRTVTCTATNPNSEVIDPFGNVHTCTETPLVPAYNVPVPAHASLRIIEVGVTTHPRNRYSSGHVEGSTHHDDEGRDLRDFLTMVQDKAYDCHSCAMLPVCGGRCPLSWKHGHIPCPSPKYNMIQRLQLWFTAQQQP